MSLPTDHSKIANTMIFNFHSDSGHGWLAVKNSLVRELGLAKQITQCSYMQGNSSYLEEDVDMIRFLNAFRIKFGVEAQIKFLKSRNNSAIRYFKRFEMEE
jgi:hypothetical protein